MFLETSNKVPLLESYQADPLTRLADDRWFIPRFAYSQLLAGMLQAIGYSEEELIQAGMKSVEEALPELSRMLGIFGNIPLLSDMTGFTSFAEIEMILPDWFTVPVVVATTVEQQDEFGVYTVSVLLYPAEQQDYVKQQRKESKNSPPRLAPGLPLIVPFRAGPRRTED